MWPVSATYLSDYSLSDNLFFIMHIKNISEEPMGGGFNPLATPLALPASKSDFHLWSYSGIYRTCIISFSAHKFITRAAATYLSDYAAALLIRVLQRCQVNKSFHSYVCAYALGRVNRYPESCRYRIKNALKEYH